MQRNHDLDYRPEHVIHKLREEYQNHISADKWHRPITPESAQHILENHKDFVKLTHMTFKNKLVDLHQMVLDDSDHFFLVKENDPLSIQFLRKNFKKEERPFVPDNLDRFKSTMVRKPMMFFVYMQSNHHHSKHLDVKVHVFKHTEIENVLLVQWHSYKKDNKRFFPFAGIHKR